MSESLIRTLASGKFKDLRVPSDYDANVGSGTKRIPPKAGSLPEDMSKLEAEVLGRTPRATFVAKRGPAEQVVEEAGLTLVARFKNAQDQLKGKGKKQGKLDALDPIAEHVRTVAVNASDSDGAPTVLADVAAALMALDQPTRDMVLRRAGNPEVFEPLRNSALPEPDADGTIRGTMAMERARGRLRAEEKAATAKPKRPAVKEWSSHFARPDEINKAGEITDANQSYNQYKKTKPRNIDPMEVTEDSAQSTKDTALRSLAGDQLSQLRAIQARKLTEMGYSEAQVKGMSKAQRDEIVDLNDATLPGPGGAPARGPQALTVGTDPNYWKPGDRRRAGGDRSGATTGDVLDRRNKGNLDRVVEMLYKKSMPKPVTDATTGMVKLTDEAGKPMRFADPADTTIDMDQFFPWWRARFATMDKDGNLTYPDRLPTAEFVTGLIESTHGITDEGFFDRVVPLIQRSIDAAPDVPDPNPKYAGRGRTAQQYSQMVFLPSPSFQKTMQQGVGSKDMPYEIYGPRKVPRDAVTAPERHPYTEQMQQSEEAMQDADAQFQEQLKRFKSPGLTDQSSINRLPPNSPMQYLLA